MLSPAFSPRISTTDRGSRIARLFPHFATCMTTSEIYNYAMYILAVTAEIFKTGTGSPWRFFQPDLASFRRTKRSLAEASSPAARQTKPALQFGRKADRALGHSANSCD